MRNWIFASPDIVSEKNTGEQEFFAEFPAFTHFLSPEDRGCRIATRGKPNADERLHGIFLSDCVPRLGGINGE